ncbi:hypothetical protein M0R45_031612 [Rubus argutus]|uniref:K-box domain-containing protein n=1 Tax=Rubus argutus TaxID=59490 RepID=A0AAW1WE71_RUBAR
MGRGKIHISRIENRTTRQYCSDSTSMEEIIRRYQYASGTRIPQPQHSDAEILNAEMRKIKKETQELHLSLQRYTGEDLSCVRFEDLGELENQLEESINRVRARKFEILQQEVNNLRISTKQREEQNNELCHLIKEHQAALLFAHHHHYQQHVEMEPKSEEQPTSNGAIPILL